MLIVDYCSEHLPLFNSTCTLVSRDKLVEIQ